MFGDDSFGAQAFSSYYYVVVTTTSNGQLILTICGGEQNMQLLKQSTVATVIVGPVLDSTGAAYTSAVIGDFNITKNGTTAAMAATATATHSHNGTYLIALTTGNTDTLGMLDISLNKSTYAMGPRSFEVLTSSTFDALVTNAATAAGGLLDSVRIGGTTQTGRDIGASVLLSTGTGTGQLDFTSGVVKANTTQISGTAQTARDIGASVLLSNGTGTGQVKLSGGYVAPNWGDVGNSTTTVALTGTTISTTQKVDIDTIKTNAVVNAGTVTFPTNATLASTTNITTATGITLGNTSHGGSSSTLILKSINISNSTGDAVTISSTGSDGHAIYASANGGGDGMHIVGGSTGHGLHLQGGSTSGDGLHSVAQTSGDGIQATGAGAGLDINGTLSAVTLVNGLAANVITATSIAADAITDAKVASDVTIASVTGSVGSISGITFPTNFGVLSISATTGLVNITQTAADKVWATTTRTVSAATNITSDGNTISQTQLSNLDAAISTRMGSYTQPAGFLAATFPSVVASTTNITGGTITNLTNAPTVGDFTATMKASITTAASSSTPTVTVGTNNDKAGYTLVQIFPTNFSDLDITSGTGIVSADIKAINAVDTAAIVMQTLYSAFENGTAQDGDTSNITLRSEASSIDEYYKDQAIIITSGTGSVQTNRIISYNGTTKIATVKAPWATIVDNTSVYVLLGRIG